MNPDELCRALHLASPALPIGSFSYSQGLETAVELGIIRTEEAALKWIADGLTELVGHNHQRIRMRILPIGTLGSFAVANRWNCDGKRNKWVGHYSNSLTP